MKKIAAGAIGALLIVPFSLPANALTCAQQAQVCAKIAKQNGQPQYVPQCLSSERIAQCRATCIWTGTNGSQFRASGDCKAS